MKLIAELKTELRSGALSPMLRRMYCCTEEDTSVHIGRFLRVLEGLETAYGSHAAASLFSAPGRAEIGGNHTDHQHGCVLAGSVNMDMIAAVGENELKQLRVTSEGYGSFSIDLSDLEKRPEEENTTAAILRGICWAFSDRGAVLSGLDMFVSSDVPKGCGVSSSAAFEVLLGTVLSEIFMGVSPVEIARIGQWAENRYFGKPCGLMDQIASAVGGVVAIDFADPENPLVSAVELELADAGLCLCILDTGGDHADLTDEYAAVPNECTQVANACGGAFLRDVPYEVFLDRIPELRESCSDRSILRAIHFYHENERAQQEAQALKNKDYRTFLKLVNESGDSSWKYLQNITPAGAVGHQSVGLALALAGELLHGEGAVRVHGGGFAGTVQAFVPVGMADRFREKTERVFGAGACRVLSIRPVGGCRLA